MKPCNRVTALEERNSVISTERSEWRDLSTTLEMTMGALGMTMGALEMTGMVVGMTGG